MSSLFQTLVIGPLKEDAKAISEGRKPVALDNSLEILEKTLNQIEYPDESMSCFKVETARGIRG